MRVLGWNHPPVARFLDILAGLLGLDQFWWHRLGRKLRCLYSGVKSLSHLKVKLADVNLRKHLMPAYMGLLNT